MIDRGSLSPDQLRTANGGRLKSISPMSKSYQLTDSIEAPWRHSRSVFYFSLDTSFFFIDELCAPVFNVDLLLQEVPVRPSCWELVSLRPLPVLAQYLPATRLDN